MRMINMRKAAAIALTGLLLLTGLFSQSVPQNVLDTLNEQSDLGAAVLSDLTRSSNTLGGHPAEFLVDGNDASWYGFQSGSTYGWVRMDFEAPVFLERLSLEGQLPQETLLYLQTEKDGELITLPAGYYMGGGNDFVLDLSRDRQAVENLIIRFQGSDLGDAILSELSLLTNSVDGDLHKKVLLPSEMPYNKKTLNNHYPLVDGLIGTVWTNENTGFQSQIYWLYDNEIQSGYHGNRPWTKEDSIVLNLDEPATGEFLKFYLTDEGAGVLALEASVEGEWIPLADYDLNTGSGWQRVDLSDLGEIEAVRLIMSDPSQPWQPGFYGGIGEVEFWSRQNRPDSYMKDLIPPSFDFSVKDSLFTLDEKDEKSYVIRTVTDNPLGEAPVLFINSHELVAAENKTGGNTNTWDFTVEEHLLLTGENSLTFQTEDRILSSHLLISAEEGLELDSSTLSDGFRYSGEDFAEDYLETALTDGRAEAEEITLYYDGYAPGNISVSRDGNYTGLTPDESISGKIVYWLTRLLDRIGINYPTTLREAVVKGSHDEILNPSIELLFPLDTIELPNYVAGHYKVIGITDTPEGEITVNGVTAQVRDNYFWVEMRDLGLQTEGTYLLEAKVVHPNGNEAYHRASILMETQSSDIRLNQDDRFYTTSDDSFTLSGQVTGSGRDFKINNQLVSLPWSGQFTEDVPLNEGLNIIRAELYDGDTLVKRLTRQVYRQSIEPNLTILTPSPDSMTNQDTIGVSGLVSPWGLERITVNGLEAQASGGSFSITGVPLPGETTILRVQAFYETGLTSEKSLTVYKDQIAPIISGVTPEPDTPVKYDSILVSGYVEEDNQATVFINGLIAPVVGGTFSLDVPLPVEGNNLIRISAQDEAGNTADWPPFNVFKDTFGPEPFDIVMTPEGWTSDTRPVIEFETIDTGIGMGRYEVSVNGGSFVEQESPYRLPRLPDGEIRIVVRALDLFDNYTDEETTAFIDTLPPDEAGNFRIVPGNKEVLFRWEEDDDESVSFILGREGSDNTNIVERREGVPEGDILDVFHFEKAWDGLESGETYRFSIRAVDRAGNIGNQVWREVVTGTTSTDIKANGPTLLEYDSLELYLPQGSLSKEIDSVILEEKDDTLSLGKSTNPVLSPVYNLKAERDGDVLDHYIFEKPFIGEISFDSESLPAGVEERQLAVFYYDEDWERWFITDDNMVNLETHTITFATDHFTEFTVQPTMAEQIDPSRWRDLDYPLTSETVNHTPIEVSPQTGAASAAMTELVLPGDNGLDLILARNYSSTVADSDSTLLPVNDRSLHSSYFSENPINDYGTFLANSKSNCSTWQQTQRKNMLMNRVEYALSLGQGWRLDLPYLKYGDDYVMAYIPGTGSIMTSEMAKSRDDKDIVYRDNLEGRATLRLVKDDYIDNFYGIARGIVRIEAVTKDGTTYTFNKLGQITEIKDTYDNSIAFEYRNGGFNLEQITDTRDRKILFTYYEGENYESFIPLITDINVYAPQTSLEDDPDYSIGYAYDIDQDHTVGLPLLLEATDVKDRKWTYRYGMQYLKTEYTARDTYTDYDYPKDENGDYTYDEEGKLIYHTEEKEVPAYYPNHVKSQYVFPLTEIDGTGVGYQRVNYGSSQMQRSEGSLDYTSLKNSFERMGSDREMAAEIQYLAAKRIEHFDHPSRTEDHLKKNVDYSYGVSKGRISSATVSDGRLKESFGFGKWTYKFNERVYYKTPLTSSDGSTEDHRDIEREVEKNFETSRTTYVKRNGAWEKTETRSRAYEGSRPLMARETVTRGASGHTVSLTTSYSYDSWANAIKITTTESNGLSASTITDYHWYNTGGPSLPSGDETAESPLAESSLDEKIKDRLLRTYSTIQTTGNQYVERHEEEMESVYEYNTAGNLTARADYADDGQWNISRYFYNNDGQIIRIVSPLEQTTDFAYDYSNPSYDLITTTERDIVLADGTLTDRVSSRNENPVTGAVLSETRADGEITVYERDLLDRVVQLTGIKEEHESAAPVTDIDYDDDNLTVTITDPLGMKTYYGFNNRGEVEVIRRFDRNGSELQETLVEQDYYGNVAGITTPAGDVLNYTYDGLNRLTAETYTEEGQNRLVTYDYLPNSHRVLRTDEEGYRTLTYLDINGREQRIQNLNDNDNAIREERYYYAADGRLLAMKDGLDQYTTYRYDTLGQLIVTESPEAEFFQNGTAVTGSLTAKSEYNEAGQVIREANFIKSGTNETLLNEKLLTYDTLGRLVTETVPFTGNNGVTAEAVQTHVYDILDREVLTTDPRGEEWTKEYTKRNQISKEITPLGAEVTYSYDLKDRPLTLTDARENSGNYIDYNGTLTYRYDDLDRLIAGELPSRPGEANRIISFEYDKEGNLLKRTEPDGGTTSYTYTEQNQVKTETRSNADETVEYEATYNYDARGNQTMITAPGGAVTRMEYDYRNRTSRLVLPEGAVLEYVYNRNDQLLREINGRGFETYYEYDALNRVKRTTDTKGENWYTFYDGQGNITKTLDPNNVTRLTDYDERAQVLRETDGRGNVTSYSYDPNGNLKEMNDPRGTTVGYTYREDNLPTTVRYINGGEGKDRTLTYTYDEAGALKEASDNGIVTVYNTTDDTYAPDAMGQITRRTTVGYNDVAYSYDNMDRLTGLTNGTHTPVNYSYNSLGQLTDITGYANSFTYDNAGRMTGYTQANGVFMTKNYDGQNRPTALDYANSTETLKAYAYTWDKTDNLVEENDSLYLYDARDMLAMAMLDSNIVNAEEEEIDPARFGQTDSYRTAEGDVIGETALEKIEGANDYTVDHSARSVGLDLGYPYYIGKIILNVEGSLDHRVTEDNITVHTAQNNRDGEYTQAEIKSYTEDLNEEGTGTITIELMTREVARFVKVTSLWNTRDGEYNAIPDATMALDPETPFTVYQLVGGGRNEYYLYDQKGNRQRKTIDVTIEDYEYFDDSDWLESDGKYTYTYDKNGNRIAKRSKVDTTDPVYEEWKYTYDLRNRLEQVEKKLYEETDFTTVATYLYDIDGYRIEKTNTEGEKTRYVFDIRGNMIEEIKEGESARYIFMGMTHIAKETDTETHYFGVNHLGSTTLVTDETGEIVEEFTDETTPFGDQENKKMFFTGKQWDEDAQLYYFNARWYDAETGGFITEDPVKDGLLWYAYVSNNPLKYMDPTGLRKVRENPKADEERERERRKKDQKVKDHFEYMDGYDLTDEERDNYSQLVDKQNEIDSARGRNKRRLQKEYTEMLTGMLHRQQDEGMSPDGYEGGACHYRSIQAGVERATGRPMPLSMINQSTKDLAGGLGLPLMVEDENGYLNNDYTVFDYGEIANDALAKLGLNNHLNAMREPKIDPMMNDNGYRAKNPFNTFTIRRRTGHYGLGDHNGNFAWDPYYGNTDEIPSPLEIRRITLEYK